MPSTVRQWAAALLLCCGAVPAWAQYSVAAGASSDIPAGASFDAACGTVDVQGQLNVMGRLQTGGDLVVGPAGELNGNGGTIALGGNMVGTGVFNAGTGTVELTDGCAGNTSQLSGTLVFNNLVLSSTTGRTFVIPAGGQITVLGTLTLQGVAGQNIQLVSSGGGTAVINLGPAASVTRGFAAVAGNVQIGAAPATVQGIPTLSEYGVMLLGALLGLLAWARQASAMRIQTRREVW